jgi:hypothetical protein
LPENEVRAVVCCGFEALTPLNEGRKALLPAARLDAR